MAGTNKTGETLSVLRSVVQLTVIRKRVGRGIYTDVARGPGQALGHFLDVSRVNDISEIVGRFALRNKRQRQRYSSVLQLLLLAKYQYGRVMGLG